MHGEELEGETRKRDEDELRYSKDSLVVCCGRRLDGRESQDDAESSRAKFPETLMPDGREVQARRH